MAAKSVTKPEVQPVREDMKYDNDSMRGLSIFLGRKDIAEHLGKLSPEQRSGIESYAYSSRIAAISHLKTLGKLLSGYDEVYDDVTPFEIGWLVASLAHDAEAADCLADLCSGETLLAEIRAGKEAA